jgi:tRNA U38,U39,U40 pseudouridine synthase TruA
MQWPALNRRSLQIMSTAGSHSLIEVIAVCLLQRVNATMQLLSFLARETSVSVRWQSTLREVAVQETTMTRTVAVSVRAGGYLASEVRLMVELLKSDGRRFFSEA